MLSLLPFLFALCALTSAKNFTITFEGLPLNAAPPPTYANITWNGFTVSPNPCPTAQKPTLMPPRPSIPPAPFSTVLKGQC